MLEEEIPLARAEAAELIQKIREANFAEMKWQIFSFVRNLAGVGVAVAYTILNRVTGSILSSILFGLALSVWVVVESPKARNAMKKIFSSLKQMPALIKSQYESPRRLLDFPKG